MTQIVNLTRLAPDIQEAVLFLAPVVRGRDPVAVQVGDHLCVGWTAQPRGEVHHARIRVPAHATGRVNLGPQGNPSDVCDDEHAAIVKLQIAMLQPEEDRAGNRAKCGQLMSSRPRYL